jgi:ParB/RepB/Spo0J family partition protein
MKIKITNITVKPDRQRRSYSKEGIDSLAASMSKRQINPITVEDAGLRDSDGEQTFNLIAGERRLIAAKQLNWQEIEGQLVTDLDDLEREEIELDENLQRENLSWQEEVAAKKRIWEIRAKLYGETVDQVAQHVGMSRGSLWEDARLAKVMEDIPELGNAKNKSQAMNKLRLLTRRAALTELAEREKQIRGSIAGEREDYSGRVKIGDCVEIMKGWANEIVHCVITDPPYGIDLDKGETKKGSAHPTIYHDDHYDIMEVVSLAAKEAYRVLKPSTHAYFWFDVKAYQKVFELLSSVGFTVDPVPLVWVKNTPGQVNHPESRWASGYEACFFCRKGPSHRALLKQGQTNVLKYDVVPPAKKIHPVEKPTAMLRQLIESSTVDGEVVLDMFAGSGSLGEAAIQTGRNFLLIERDPAFHAGILDRLARCTPASDAVLESISERDSVFEASKAAITQDLEMMEEEEADMDAALERHRGGK